MRVIGLKLGTGVGRKLKEVEYCTALHLDVQKKQIFLVILKKDRNK